jgi:plasmid stability protein
MATFTVKNIPDDLYERLKVVACAHHRSINSEVINCLETVLKTRVLPVEERLNRIRNLRSKVDSEGLDAAEISAAIREGRA